MTGAGTARSMASSTVQRPSPESTMTGAISSKPGLGPGGPLGQLEQPAPHHRAVAPDGGDLVEVEVELVGRPHDLEALGVGLHEAVLDAVVDHLDEVPGPDRADVGVPALGAPGSGTPARPRPPPPWCPRPSGSSPRSTPRRRPRSRRRRSRCPCSASRSAVGAGLLVVGVPAVDDDVAASRSARPARRSCRRSACRPGPSPRPPGAGRAWRPAPRARPPARRPSWPPRHGPRPTGRRPRPRDRRQQALGHVGAHLAQADHPDLHRRAPCDSSLSSANSCGSAEGVRPCR